MSEMVERVAEAIRVEIFRQRDFEYVSRAVLLDEAALARAAIAAMREPTEAIVDSVCTIDGTDYDEQTKATWRKMIGAALEPAGAEAPAE